MRKVNIGLADDHLPTRTSILAYLKAKERFNVCIEAVDGCDLISQIHLKKDFPEVILLDINMPQIDGVTVTFYLRYYFPNVRIVGLSVYDDSSTISTIISSGARGYVSKANMTSVLDDAIESILAGEIYIDERIEASVREKLLHTDYHNDIANDNTYGLTPREITFVIFNATSLTYNQIARLMFVETKTIQTYFDRVSKKLNVSSRQALTIFSIQNGLAKIANYPKQTVVNKNCLNNY